MDKRSMSLGEEIIALSNKGVDIPTIKRMHRKYLDIITKERAESKHCFLSDVVVGDQIEIPLEGLGTFTATAYKVTDDKVLFIFDDYVTRRPMNNKNTNKGGYDESDLKDWIDIELFNKFPREFRKRMLNLTLPTVGQLFGWNDEWARNAFERDDNEQLPLMKLRCNRVAYYYDKTSYGWLRNTTKKSVSSMYFASMSVDGNASRDYASTASLGIRPEFWLRR